MTVVEHFLNRQSVCQRVVESTLDYTFGGVTTHKGGRKRPSVSVEARVILQTGTKHIVRVGISGHASETGGIFRRISGVVGRTSHSSETERHSLGTNAHCLRAERIRGHAAQTAPVETSGTRIGKINAVDISFLHLGIISAHAEVHGLEVVTGLLVIDIVTGTLDGGHRLVRTVIIKQFHLIKDVVCASIKRIRSITRLRQLDSAEVFHAASHYADVDKSVFISVSHDFKHIGAHLRVGDGKRPVGIGHYQNALILQQDRGIAHRLVVGTVSHDAAQSRGGQGRQREREAQ